MSDAEHAKLISSLRSHGITNEEVLQAIATIPRDIFVGQGCKQYAYSDIALPIDCNQTISQPYIVALMTQTLLARGNVKKVLEVGTGSGYQAAILANLVDEVYTIERIKSLYLKAKETLAKLKCANVRAQYGDGMLGWPEHTPFDGIIVTAAAEKIPKKLLEQLNPDEGRLVIPVNIERGQELLVVTRKQDHYVTELIEYVNFVPLRPGIEE